MPQISVVIPTRGNAEALERCLAALVAQDFDRREFEVIVVDATFDSRIRQVVGRWGMLTHGAPAMRYIPADAASGSAAARNAGWRAASGEIVAFTRDFLVPRRDWLSKGAIAMASGVNAAAGRVAAAPGVVLVEEDDLDPVAARTFGLATSNCFVQRQSLRAVGGFDERFSDGWDDDSDLQFTLIKAHAQLAAADEAVVESPPRPPGLRGVLRQYRKSSSDALLFKKHRGLYRERSRRDAPWSHYAIVGALLVVVAGALLREPMWSWTGLGIWLAFSADLFTRRLRVSRGDVSEALAATIAIPPVAVFWRLAGALRFRVLYL